MKAPLRIKFWEHLTGYQYGMVGELRDYTTIDVSPRFNSAGTWAYTAPWGVQSATVEKGMLVTFDALLPDGTYWRPLTGVVDAPAVGAVETGQIESEASGSSVLSVLGGVLNWQKPTAALTAQADTHYEATGAAETVLSALVQAQAVTRLGLPVRVMPSSGRGGSVTLKERMSVLLGTLQEKSELAGLGFDLGLVDTSGTRAELQFGFYQPQDRSAYVKLSHKVGSLRTWKHNEEAPSVTRAIVMGGGEGVARIYRRRDTPGIEAEWGGWPREVAVDARDTTVLTELDERGDTTLLESASQSSFELEAVASAGQRLGSEFKLGDIVGIELATGLSTTDRLRGAVITVGSEGVTQQLIPGNPDTTGEGGPVAVLFKQAAIIRELRGRLQALEREER